MVNVYFIGVERESDEGTACWMHNPTTTKMQKYFWFGGWLVLIFLAVQRTYFFNTFGCRTTWWVEQFGKQDKDRLGTLNVLVWLVLANWKNQEHEHNRGKHYMTMQCINQPSVPPVAIYKQKKVVVPKLLRDFEGFWSIIGCK